MTAFTQPTNLSGARIAFVNSVCVRNTTNSCLYDGLAHTLVHAQPPSEQLLRDIFVPSLTSSFSPEWINESVFSSARNVNWVSFSLNYRLKYKDISTVFATLREERTGFCNKNNNTETNRKQQT